MFTLTLQLVVNKSVSLLFVISKKDCFDAFTHQVARAIQFHFMFEIILISSSPLSISFTARIQMLCENVLKISAHLLCMRDRRQIKRKLMSRQVSRTVIKLSHPTASELYTQSITSPSQQTRTPLESVCSPDILQPRSDDSIRSRIYTSGIFGG